jgi:hypothetical protein
MMKKFLPLKKQACITPSIGVRTHLSCMTSGSSDRALIYEAVADMAAVDTEVASSRHPVVNISARVAV